MSVTKEFLYERIYRDLLDAIENGTYQPGDRLPSEKELAQSYGASRITSKRALEMLSGQGLIRRMPGRGSFVTQPSSAAAQTRFKEPQNAAAASPLFAEAQGAATASSRRTGAREEAAALARHIGTQEEAAASPLFAEAQEEAATSSRRMGVQEEAAASARRSDTKGMAVASLLPGEAQDGAKNLSVALPRVTRRDGRKMVGVIFDSFGCDFGMDLLRSIEQECGKRNYDMTFRCTNGSVEEENLAIWNAVEAGAQGLILMCAQNETYNTTIIQLSLDHFPMVLVDRQMQGISIPCIKTDNYQAARELTRLLIQKGCKSVCFVSHSAMSTTTIRERHEGFVDEIVADGEAKGRTVEISGYHPVTANEEMEYESFDFTEIRKAILDNSDCSAFLAVEYKLGVLFSRELKKLGMEDRRIVSFDGLGHMYVENSFTYLKQNEREMGVEAVRTLDRIVSGESVKGNICIPFQIIER